jgi:hypothetical protein
MHPGMTFEDEMTAEYRRISDSRLDSLESGQILECSKLGNRLLVRMSEWKTDNVSISDALSKKQRCLVVERPVKNVVSVGEIADEAFFCGFGNAGIGARFLLEIFPFIAS